MRIGMMISGRMRMDMVSRGIGLVVRSDTEERVDKWIQEIEEVMEESLRCQEELESGEFGRAWDD
eukprot:520904-Karenia_brevis.AAC.1